jgi:hypothetical protein
LKSVEVIKDIDAALKEDSLDHLSLALAQGQRGAKSHRLMEAVRHQHIEALKFLLQKGVCDVDEPCCGERPLHAALSLCNTADDPGYYMAKELLKHGACPDALPVDGEYLQAPLHTVAAHASLAGVCLLLEYGANPNGVDKNGYTALHIACRNLSFVEFVDAPFKIVDALLHEGADPTKKDCYGKLPVEYASTSCIRQKLARAVCWWHRRALHVACRPFATMHSAGRTAPVGMNEAVSTCFSLPELSGSIAAFV